jgi:hypothetical protein
VSILLYTCTCICIWFPHDVHIHTYIHTYMGGGRNSRDKNVPCVAMLTLSNKKTDVPFIRLIFSLFDMPFWASCRERERERERELCQELLQSCVRNCYRAVLGTALILGAWGNIYRCRSASRTAVHQSGDTVFDNLMPLPQHLL